MSLSFGQEEPNCDYLRQEKGAFIGITSSSSQEEINAEFDAAYALNVCEGFLEIDADALEYVQGIKKTE